MLVNVINGEIKQIKSNICILSSTHDADVMKHALKV